MSKQNPLKDKIDAAIQNDDFKDVSDLIEKSVESAIRYTKVGANAVARGVRRGFNNEPEVLKVNRDPEKVAQKVTAPNTWFWLRNTFALGTVSTAVLFIALLFGWIFTFYSDFLPAALFFLTSGPFSAFLTLVTHKNMVLAKDFYRIRREIGDNLVLATEDITTALNKPKKDVVQALAKMIDKGFFPQGRIVESGELLLLDRTTYEAYKKHYRGEYMVQQTPRHLEEEQANEKPPIEDDRAEAVDRYRDKLKNQLSRTHAQTLKTYIQKLIKLTDSIDHAIDADGKRVEDLNKFSDYYAPTTIKLIERYIQFESSAVITDTIQSAMTDIIKSLDTVTSAYEKLLDTLYKDDLLELHAEMNVMETVLKQDGLYGKGISEEVENDRRN